MVIRTTDLDRIFASAPASRQAAVVAGKGVHWESPIQDDSGRSDDPLPIFPFDTRGGGKDLTGSVVGRFRILGYGGTYKNAAGKSVGARWVGRCACGRYQRFKTRSITAPSEADMKCDRCKYLVGIKDGEQWAFDKFDAAQAKSKVGP